MTHLITTALGLALGIFSYEAFSKHDWGGAAWIAYHQTMALAIFGFMAWVFGWPL